MNKKGYLGNFIFAFVMIGVTAMVMFTIFPVIQDQIGEAQMNISGTPSPISEDLVGMLDYVPWIFAASIGFIIFIMAWRMIAGGNDVEDVDYTPSERDDKDDDEEDYEETEVEVEIEEKPKRSTIVTTKKRDGNVKTNIKLSPTGYNVDKYELDKPIDNKLSLKEADFKKTKFD